MTTLDDFRENLTTDSVHWLVLADWLEEQGDERVVGVRSIARSDFTLMRLADSYVWSSRWFTRDLRKHGVQSSLLEETLAASYISCFDAVMALAHAWMASENIFPSGDS